MPETQLSPACLPSVPPPAGWSRAPAPGRSELDIASVQEFKALMADEGQPVEVARMFADRLYAYERIACAHASAQAELRRLALALFQRCHHADELRRALS